MKTWKRSQFIRAAAFIILVASGATRAAADALTLVWSRTYSGQGLAGGSGIAVDDSGVYLGGTTWPAGGKDDAFLVRFDGAGNMVWDRTWGGSSYDRGGRVTLFGSSVYVAGNTYSFAYDPVGGIESDAITLKYSKDGVLNMSNSPNGWWTRFSGDSGYYGYDYAGDLALDGSGNLYVVGSSERAYNNIWTYVQKYDAAGALQWYQNYGSFSGGGNGSNGLALAGDTLYTAGHSGRGANEQVLALKYSIDGAPVWADSWGEATNDRGYGVAVYGEDLFVTGNLGADLLLLKLHDNGSSVDYVASTTFSGPGNNVGYGIKVANDTVYIAGSTVVGGQTDALLLSYDSDLNLLWSYSWGGAANDSANDLVVRDGILYVAGTLGNQAFVDAYGVLGDLNCDGVISHGDINPFVQYLSNFSAWQAMYPDCSPQNGDINGDGTYGQGSFGDINPFVALLSGP